MMTMDYSTSKFYNAITKKLWDMSLDGMHDGEIGTVDDIGWHGIFVFASDGEYIRKGLVGAILREDSQGFVTSEVFTTMDTLNEAIAALEAEVECYADEVLQHLRSK